MKKIFVSILLPMCLLTAIVISTAPATYAQTAVEVSKEKVRVNGTLMYAHKVLKGQTVYSICKAYDVTPEELQKVNPALASGLKEGMLLVVPITTPEQKSLKEKAKDLGEKVEEKGGKLVEKVDEKGSKLADKTVELADKTAEKSEELWQKTKDFIVGEEPAKAEPAKAEPAKAEPAKAEPVKAEPAKAEPVKAAVQEGDTYIEHKVKWYEDFDEIANQYKINKELIKFYNGISSESLDKISTLKIPTDQTLERVKKEYVQSLHKGGAKPNNTLPQPYFDEEQSPALQIFTLKDTTEKEIAVILPLHSKNKLSATYMDFYSGALLAAQELNNQDAMYGQMGGKYKFKFIDQSEYMSAESLIRKNHLENSDIIVGPIRSSDIKEYINFINEKKIPMISPLDPSAEELSRESEYLFQVPVGTKLQSKAIAEMTAEFENASRNNAVTVVYEEGGSDTKLSGEILEFLDKKNVSYSKISFPITKAVEIGATFKKKFNPLYNNLVVVASNNEAFVAEALRNLSILGFQQDNIIVLGTNKWRNFETMDLNLFFQFNVHLVCPYFVDLSKYNVQKFIKEYREAYSAEPSANAFNGYDIVKFAALYSKKAPQGVPFSMEGVQQSFLVAAGSTKNNAITGVVYHSNYSVTSRTLIISVDDSEEPKETPAE